MTDWKAAYIELAERYIQVKHERDVARALRARYGQELAELRASITN